MSEKIHQRIKSKSGVNSTQKEWNCKFSFINNCFLSLRYEYQVLVLNKMYQRELKDNLTAVSHTYRIGNVNEGLVKTYLKSLTSLMFTYWCFIFEPPRFFSGRICFLSDPKSLNMKLKIKTENNGIDSRSNFLLKKLVFRKKIQACDILLLEDIIKWKKKTQL